MLKTPQHILIIGAGLAGSLLAILLRKEGFTVEVVEKRNDPRSAERTEGRSINLALSYRGIKALQAADVYEAVATDLIPMSGRMIHDLQGDLTYQPYGKTGQSIQSVSRNQLNIHLINAAEKAGVQFHFDSKCTNINLEANLLDFETGQKTHSLTADLIIGADGAFSVFRKHLMMNDRFNYSQYYIEHGYKELAMPPVDGDFAMKPNYLHIWPRGNFMLIALPNPDKTFTCTLFFPFEGAPSFAAIQTPEQADQFLRNHFPDAYDKIPDMTGQFLANPTSSLVTVRCYPWHHNRSVLIGDAAHAIVPFYGQGMNASFEDCLVFMDVAKKQDFNWPDVLPAFSVKRKPDADAIADLALKNFVEMRDQVADTAFLERKKADARMHEKYGDEWIPQYTMVTFTDKPYRDALALGNMQQLALLDAQKSGFLQDTERVMALFRQIAPDAG